MLLSANLKYRINKSGTAPVILPSQLQISSEYLGKLLHSDGRNHSILACFCVSFLNAIFIPAGLTHNADAILPFIILNPTDFAACTAAQAAVIVGLVPPTLSF